LLIPATDDSTDSYYVGTKKLKQAMPGVTEDTLYVTSRTTC